MNTNLQDEARTKVGSYRGRQSFNKQTVECYSRHELGHFHQECPAKQEGEANYTGSQEQVLLLMAC